MSSPRRQPPHTLSARRGHTVAARRLGAWLVAIAVLCPLAAPADPPPTADNRVRIGQLLQLGRSHAPNAREELEKALNDPTDTIRLAATVGLVALGDPAAIPALERRQRVETAPAVKAKLESAAAEVRLAAVDRAKYVVQVGQMTNATAVQNAAIPAVMRAAARSRASYLKGAVVVDGPTDALYQRAVSRNIPVLLLDGQLSKLSRGEVSGGVTIAANVEFVVRAVPTQVLKGTFRGNATSTDTPKALESKQRLAELEGQAVSNAVESALRGVEKTLVEASK